MKVIMLFIYCCIASLFVFSQDADIQKKLAPFDKEMEIALKKWNMPGLGIGVVKKGKLVYAKGYGYRDYEKKLPVTENTLFQIASNTKLFTATAIGLLVNEGKLDWDKPIRNYVPSIQFYNNELNNAVTIRDMLSHRTGITRHDAIWYKSEATRSEMFSKIKYMEPAQPLRQGFLYNNLMYAAAGQIVELLEGKTWETYINEKILQPLKMSNTCFSIEDMKKKPDYFVPYNERRDTDILYKTPYYEDTKGVGPCGAIISSISDLSHWLAGLMNKGIFEGKQVIPETVVNASMEPAVALPDFELGKGLDNLVLNPVYGMGRQSFIYRGHKVILHGGDLRGIHSQISYMPQDSLGVIVFVIGDQSFGYNGITCNIYEHLLGLSITPWSERYLENKEAQKKLGKEGRNKALAGQVRNTKSSHSISDYLGNFTNDAYGNINIAMKDTQLLFSFNKIHLPLHHFHYDRFDTENDEEDGYYSLNYQTNPQGEIDQFTVSLDEAQVIFVRKADSSLSNTETLKKYAGKYKTGEQVINVILKNNNHLFIKGAPDIELIPYKTHVFKTKEFADISFEFIVESGIVKAMKQKDPSGEYEVKRAEDEK